METDSRFRPWIYVCWKRSWREDEGSLRPPVFLELALDQEKQPGWFIDTDGRAWLRLQPRDVASLGNRARFLHMQPPQLFNPWFDQGDGVIHRWGGSEDCVGWLESQYHVSMESRTAPWYISLDREKAHACYRKQLMEYFFTHTVAEPQPVYILRRDQTGGQISVRIAIMEVHHQAEKFWATLIEVESNQIIGCITTEGEIRTEDGAATGSHFGVLDVWEDGQLVTFSLSHAIKERGRI